MPYRECVFFVSIRGGNFARYKPPLYSFVLCLYLALYSRYSVLLQHYNTKTRNIRQLCLLLRVIEYISLRREWDLNPRMTVLQTVALGHLAIPPIGLLRGKYTRYGRLCQDEINDFLNFLNRCRIWSVDGLV